MCISRGCETEWENITRNLRNKNFLAIHDSVEFVEDKLNHGLVAVRELQT